MDYTAQGRLCQGVGGQYLVKLDGDGDHPLSGLYVTSAARGKFRYHGETPLCGDIVTVRYSDNSFVKDTNGKIIPDPNGTDIMLDSIAPRKNELIRPAMANLEGMIIVCSVSHPQTPDLTLDKLTAIAVHEKTQPLILFSKADLDEDLCTRLTAKYASLGFRTLGISLRTGQGLETLRSILDTFLPGKVSCLCGASGVGKSSLINALFPHLKRKTGEISHKNRRGKNTTREITLFDLSECGYDGGWLADTPGFSMIDFEHFDFMGAEDLVYAFPEFSPYLFTCRYMDCAHVKEEGCAILEAVKNGMIPKSRHESYATLLGILKEKKPWNTGR